MLIKGTQESATVNAVIVFIKVAIVLVFIAIGWHFINPANGVYLQDAQGTPTANDTPSPATITAGTPAFGIHACDANSKVSTSTWGQATAKFANPSASFYYTLVNSASEPASGGDKITIEYAATPASTTPAGDYRAVLTYVASVVF